jgi:hypothetical protein
MYQQILTWLSNPVNWIWLLAIAVVIFFFVAVIKVLVYLSKYDLSRNWPQAWAKVENPVVKSRRVRGGKIYWTEINYTYPVFGSEFQGRLVMKNIRANQQNALNYAEKYPSGKTFSVNYNPDKPGEHYSDDGKAAAFSRFRRQMFNTAIFVVVFVILCLVAPL